MEFHLFGLRFNTGLDIDGLFYFSIFNLRGEYSKRSWTHIPVISLWLPVVSSARAKKNAAEQAAYSRANPPTYRLVAELINKG